ncbi:helix-turn-helix domain-containing protein [Lachnospiraceae bacterium YH-ros2228]|jgi:excisionase family DNA binding protein|nr:helix-turn-helix domain-containing protein [Lachnospiraceae bacterium]
MSVEYENMNVEKWVNLEDIADYLSVSQDTIRTWIKEGKLPVYRAGKRYKFKISEVDEWIREGKIKNGDAVMKGADKAHGDKRN